MNLSREVRGSALACAAILVAATTWFATDSRGTPRERQTLPPSDATPAPPAGSLSPMGVSRLIRAVPFRLDEPYTHWYRSEQPEVTEGWLVVLSVSPDLVQPTNAFQPVLYASLPSGVQTLERINQGHLDGVSVALLPGDVDHPDGLRGARIWFGAPELPERLTTPAIEAEAERTAGLEMFRVSEGALRKAQPGDDVVSHKDRSALEETAAALIIQYAPSERDFAEGFLID